MAVLSSQRQVPKTEFENIFSALLMQTIEYILAVPLEEGNDGCVRKSIITRVKHIKLSLKRTNIFCANKARQIEYKKHMAVDVISHLHA